MSLSELTLARTYLAQACYTPYNLSPEMAERITAQFSDGQTPNQKITGQDLLRRLEYARFMARSFGSQNLTDDMWVKIQEIENVRTERLNKLPAKKQQSSASEPVLR